MDINNGIHTSEIQNNMSAFDKLMKEISDIKQEGVKYGQDKSKNN